MKNFKGVQKMSAYDLAERVKDRLMINSDNKLAEVLGVTRANISHWKSGRSQPDGITMLRLAEMAGLSAHDALILVNQKSEQQILNLQTGFSNVVFLSALGIGSFGATSLLKMTGTPYESIANRATELLSVYIM